MYCFIPEQMPSRSEFLIMCFDAIFPDLEALNCQKTGYGYTSACEQAAKETGLILSGREDTSLDEDSNIFRLMFELENNYEYIFGKKTNLLTNQTYKCYSDTLFSFCDQTSGSLKGWLKQTANNSRVNKSFDAALFFSYLLLSRKACEKTRNAFFEKCLEYVGITNIEDAVSYKLFNYDWSELGAQDMINERAFSRLDNHAIIFLGTVVLTIFELIGTYSVERDKAKIEKLHILISQAFQHDIQASNAMKRAEHILFNCNKYFDPRSIQTAKKLYPQDFFVLPEFESNEEHNVAPLSLIKNASKSERLLIVAKTGLGKSAFLQMATICMLFDRYESESEYTSSLYKITEQLDAPRDLYIISIPARMFSFCYKDDRYKEWTNDFVVLFFNCIWKLAKGYNFYSSQSTRNSISYKESQDTEDEAISEELLDYIQELARKGKLLLILDSFDEISSGEMRTAYLKALASFYDKYCCYPESKEIGAHVIVSSREMAPKTMTSLEHALELESNSNKYGISQLNEKQREELVFKWNRFSNMPDDESREILNQIESNHYYLDYSVNPYMLSVICFYFGHDLGSITQRYINTLVDRMLKNNRSADPIIQDVLMNIVKLLQDVAGETITNGNPHFSRHKLDKYLSKLIDKTDLSEEDIELYIERLHEIFVTEVGLIVPADGDDCDYQFINGQIRFELAAKGIQRALDNDEKIEVYRNVILPSINMLDEYVGLLVPLLCDINLENVQLAELLVSDLAMWDFNADTDERILIRTMVDLLLNRYGSNITTASNPGDKDTKYVRRAQRMLLMRIFSSKSSYLTIQEKKELLESPAYKCNVNWFSSSAESLLHE